MSFLVSSLLRSGIIRRPILTEGGEGTTTSSSFFFGKGLLLCSVDAVVFVLTVSLTFIGKGVFFVDVAAGGGGGILISFFSSFCC